jgi:hypothetical protein
MARHCRHCLGDCPGDCLLPGGRDPCIHEAARWFPGPQRLTLLRTGAFWRRLLWGPRR